MPDELLHWSSLLRRCLFLLSILLGAEIAAEAAHIAYLQFVTFHPLPWNDEWDTMALFSAMEENSRAWRFLLLPHNEHRLVLLRLIALLDVMFAGGTGALNLLATDFLLLSIIGVWSLLLTKRSNKEQPSNIMAPYALTLCIACILLSGHQMSNLVWGFQVQVFLIYLCALIAFAMFGLALERAENGRGKQSALLTLLACGFATCAALSMGNGIIVLPTLLVIAFIHRGILPSGTIVMIGAIVAVVLGFYFKDLNTVAPFHPADFSTTALVFTRFFLRFLGGPWATIAPPSATFAGLATFLIAVYAVLRYRRFRVLRRYEVAALGVIVLVLVSAAMVTLGRIQHGIEAATESRYSTPVLMLYAAILVFLWPRVPTDAKAGQFSERTAPGKRRVLGMSIVIACALAYGAGSHSALPYDYTPLPWLKSDAEVGYVANVQDPEHFKFVASSIEQAWRARRYLRRHNLSVFSTAAGRSIDRRLTDLFAILERQCLGHLDRVERIVPGPKGGFRISGWAWDRDAGRIPRGVVLVEDGIVKGAGRFIVERPDALAATPEVTDLRNGFVGYVPREVTSVTAYALIQNGTSACLIPGELFPTTTLN